MKERIIAICSSVAEAFECVAEVDIDDYYPATVNHPEQTHHVIRLAKKWFGEEHFSQDDLPMTVSEDFSFYLQEIPGCFFALGTMKYGNPTLTLHTSTYDYNDDMIASGAYLFIRIVEDRLGVNLLKI